MLCMAAGPSTTDRCAYGVITGLDELCARRVPKESATDLRTGRMTGHKTRGRGLLALTFGTLLSSQGADAHRSKSLDLSRGNSLNVTRLASRCQTRRFAAPPAPTPQTRDLSRASRRGRGSPSGAVETHRPSGC